MHYAQDAVLVFGCETHGLPDQMLHSRDYPVVRIPTVAEARCLNLSNAVAIALFEALRQHGFDSLSRHREPKQTDGV
jgi:tRNA (cytidine/uridine-2'-O-)-methyltransferase